MAILTRRSFAVSLTGGLFSACAQAPSSSTRLQARPGAATEVCEAGTHPLGLRPQRDSLLYVPKSADPNKPASLVVYLHGATGSEQQGIRRLSALSDELGFLVLSPASKGQTWDAIREGYGPDVQGIDQALTRAFAMRKVDPRRIAVAGFSDGASYGLGLGLMNGDLFSGVIAFSPGFIPQGGKRTGKPRVFVSHGTNDQVLPIAECSRRLAPELKKAGYPVTYREFEGPHAVPPEIAKEAMLWFLA